MNDVQKDTTAALLGCVGALAMVPVLIAYPVLIGGYALMVMWGWFIVPLFHLPALSLAAACCVDLVITTVRGSPPEREETAKEKARDAGEKVFCRLLNITVFYGFVLGIGAIIKAVWS